MESKIKILNYLWGYVETIDSNFYLIPKKTLYHDVLSLVISQRISFATSRKIRHKIKEMHINKIGNEIQSTDIIFEPEVVKSIDLKSLGITNLMVLNTIENLTRLALNNIYPINLKSIRELPGIGDWTYNALLIMGHSEDQNNDIFLQEDAWIRKRLGEILGEKLTIASTRKLIDSWISSESKPVLHESVKIKMVLSRFLWRLKESGALKISKNIGLRVDLDRADFL